MKVSEDHFLPPSSPQARTLLLLLATIQFVHVLDFVVVMPLGAYLIKALDVGTTTLAAFTSVYNFAAAISGLIGAWWLDRFDRRTTLVVTLAGFTLGTLACALATSASALLLARFIAGWFGGIMQAVLFAIIGDSFSEENRGSATGVVVSAFSLASVLGVPLSLWLTEHFDWRFPFLVLAALSLFILIAASRLLPPLRHHLFDRKPDISNLALITDRNSLVGFLFITLLMFSGFTVIPFMSPYLVTNVGLKKSDLALVFLAGGAVTLFTSRLAGTLSDRFGKQRVFAWLAGLSTIPVFILTHLGHVPIAYAIVITTFFTVLVSGRSVPALAMVTSSTVSASRGRYLSLTSSVQQVASGLASLTAGIMLTLNPDGTMSNYDRAGIISIIFTLLAIITSRRLEKRS